MKNGRKFSIGVHSLLHRKLLLAMTFLIAQGCGPSEAPGDVGVELSKEDTPQSSSSALKSGIAAAAETSSDLADLSSPTVKVTAPGLLATVQGTVTVSATATDNVGVTKVEFYAGSILVGTDTTAPYIRSWDTTTVPSNLYLFSSKAYDAAGNVGISPNVLIKVKN